MNNIIENQIMNRKWHEFLHCCKSDERTSFLKKFTEDYPIIYGRNSPMAIYLDTYGFHNISEIRKINNEEQMILNILSREYIKNLIVYQIILNIENDSEIVEKINDDLITFMNNFYHDKIKVVSSIKECLQEVKEILNMMKKIIIIY